MRIMSLLVLATLCTVQALGAEVPAVEIFNEVAMVKLPGGTFSMGDADGAEDAKVVRQVTLSPFYMDIYEVTQKEFNRHMDINPSKFDDQQGPVERVRWMEAAEYCNARSRAENLTPCYNEETWECNFEADGYRLPTEAEWEFACRAGSTDALPFAAEELSRHAWIRSNSKSKTHAVGEKKPNAWGLYDMFGNVAEWCNDYYAPYDPAQTDNPTGPATGEKRVLRGSDWSSRPGRISSAARTADDPANADICQGYDTYGFRCVKRVKESE